MSLSTDFLRQCWTETQGREPVFAAVDGSNCPDLPQAEMSSHSLLLKRGLIRNFLPWPPKSAPDFKLEVLRDPTGCNTSPVYGLTSGRPTISVYRRPRVVANFKYAGNLSLMADGREPSLESQALTAVLVHEEAETRPTHAQLCQIVDLEMQVFAAQTADDRGGLLNETGGPTARKCADVGAIVMQQLRGLAARAPYFTNGSGATLSDVVDFYDRRYRIGYSSQQRDLVNFLRSL